MTRTATIDRLPTCPYCNLRPVRDVLVGEAEGGRALTVHCLDEGCIEAAYRALPEIVRASEEALAGSLL